MASEFAQSKSDYFIIWLKVYFYLKLNLELLAKKLSLARALSVFSFQLSCNGTCRSLSNHVVREQLHPKKVWHSLVNQKTKTHF